MFFFTGTLGVAGRLAFAKRSWSLGLSPDHKADAEEIAELQQYRRGNRLQNGYDERTRHAICHDRKDDERDEHARENAWRTHDCHLKVSVVDVPAENILKFLRGFRFKYILEAVGIQSDVVLSALHLSCGVTINFQFNVF